MKMKLLAENVFRPAAFPKHTYVSRKSTDIGIEIDYELRLRQALKISGCLTSIVGPSKMGKSVLCERVIDFQYLVEVSGADFTNYLEFWQTIGAKASLPMSGQYSQEQQYGEERQQKTENFMLHKDRVIEYFKEHNKVLVLDDFHYAPEESQLYIAQQLKDAIRRDFKAIVISLPHRADDAIRKNADLQGRLSLINIQPWQLQELEEIARIGFQKLTISMEERLIERVAVESLTSPQLMQYICLSICTLLDADEKEITEIPETILETAFKFTTMNFEYRDVVKVLKDGPYTRGRERKQFQVKDGNVDLYTLIIQAIAIDPPLMGMTLDELKQRIDSFITAGPKPDKKAIRDALAKLQIIIDERENIYKVFEWKDQTLYILDPMFLFYLRWGSH